MVETTKCHAGLRLRRTRLFRGLEPRDLARRLGIGVDGLDSLERGDAPLEGAVLCAAGKALGVDPSFFFRRLKRLESGGAIVGIARRGPYSNDNGDWVREPPGGSKLASVGANAPKAFRSPVE